MMAIKRKGVLAKPGKYKYGDFEETKTAEELKAAAERQPIIMLTLSHREGGLPKASDFIGTVSQKWDEVKQKVMGDYWFYDEVLPPSIRARLEQGEPVGVSPGFTVDNVEDGVQKGIFYTHVAVLEDEDPICPLNECGVNVRMESSSTKKIRLEQKTEINKEEKPVETLKEERYVKFEDLSAFKQEILEAISEMKPATEEVEEVKASGTAVDETPPGIIVTAETETVPEEPPAQPPVQAEPEQVIPADVASPSKYGPGVEETGDGWLKIVPQTKKKSE